MWEAEGQGLWSLCVVVLGEAHGAWLMLSPAWNGSLALRAALCPGSHLLPGALTKGWASPLVGVGVSLFPQGACESQLSLTQAKSSIGVYAFASVPKSWLGWHLLVFACGKKHLCVLCFSVCDNLSPRGRDAGLFPEHSEKTAGPSAEHRLAQASSQGSGTQRGTCPQRECKWMSWPMATQGWHHLDPSFPSHMFS